MSTFYIDGFTKGSNPSLIGGYTITDEAGNILKRKFVKATDINKMITNNFTEFLALHDCLFKFCKKGDTILTDSQNNLAWATAVFRKKSKRKDLLPLAILVRDLIRKKGVDLKWVPREINLAGLLNEDIIYD